MLNIHGKWLNFKVKKPIFPYNMYIRLVYSAGRRQGLIRVLVH